MSQRKPREFASFQDFWQFYLSEHSQPGTKLLHFAGTSIAIVCAATALLLPSFVLLLVGLAAGYGFAWLSHFLVEKNRPATFRHPWLSFVADLKLWAYVLAGRIDEVQHHSRQAAHK